MEDRVKAPRKRIRLADLLAEAARTGKTVDKGIIEALRDRPSTPDVAITGLDMKAVFLDEAGHLAQHQIDATAYYFDYQQAQSRIHRVQKTLADFTDAELVMEMIKRGYAAMKLPKDGGPPEALR